MEKPRPSRYLHCALDLINQHALQLKGRQCRPLPQVTVPPSVKFFAKAGKQGNTQHDTYTAKKAGIDPLAKVRADQSKACLSAVSCNALVSQGELPGHSNRRSLIYEKYVCTSLQSKKTPSRHRMKFYNQVPSPLALKARSGFLPD